MLAGGLQSPHGIREGRLGVFPRGLPGTPVSNGNAQPSATVASGARAPRLGRCTGRSTLSAGGGMLYYIYYTILYYTLHTIHTIAYTIDYNIP